MIRDWMDDTTIKKVFDLVAVLPRTVLSDAINLIETMPPNESTSESYHRRLINIMWNFKFKEECRSHCEKSSEYDKCHELCLLLDGWCWQITFDEEGDNSEFVLIKLDSPLA